METEEISLSHLPRQSMAVVLKYCHLELEINHTMSSICRPFCQSCKSVCCKAEFCIESIHSDWLRLVREVGNHSFDQFDETRGWLTPNGCRLSAGRPPLCYEFLCEKILENITPGPFSSSFKELSKLLSMAGKNALGTRHLVTLSSRAISIKLNFNRIEAKIAAATESFIRLKKELISEPSINPKATKAGRRKNDSRYRQD